MGSEIRSKDYSFPEAFNAVGKKLVPGWTGEEIEARECHSPKDVDSVDTLPKRLAEFTIDMAKAPDVDPKDLREHIDGVEHARLNRQSETWAGEIEALADDPEAYQERYDLWSRLCKAEKPFNDIMHHGHADGWIETHKGDILEIEPTHWGVRGGPFIPPQLPGTWGEYKGETGEVRIDKEILDAYLRTLAAGRKLRPIKNEATRQRNKKLAIACARCKQEDLYQHKPKSWIADKIAKEKKELGVNGTTLLRILYNDFPDWDKDPDWAK